MAPSAVHNQVADDARSTKNGTYGKPTGTAAARVQCPAKDAAAYLDPVYEILERPIGTRRPLRVACLGAGYSGLMMGIVFSQKMQNKNAELVIYERNADIGGTWLENKCVPNDERKTCH